MKSQRQIERIVTVLGILVCCTVGCRSVNRSPFATSSMGKPGPVSTEAAVAASSSAATGVPGAAANDAISQQVAAESKALSDSSVVAANPELAKYASPGGVDEPETSIRTQSFDSGSSRSSQRCSSGCCH